MIPPENIEMIIEKYLNDKASAHEIDQLDKWYNSLDLDKDFLLPAGPPASKQLLATQFAALKRKLGIV